MRINRLVKFIILVVLSYAFFKAPGVLLGKPIPGSLIYMYMFFTVLTILLVMTSTDKSAEELFAPLRALVEDPKKALLRNIIFIIVPIVAGLVTFCSLKPEDSAPVELRSIHPAPPSIIKAYGKTYDLMTLENPFRKFQKEDPVAFKELAAQGGTIYFKNCFYCHGDKLDGKGHYAHALNPAPLPFTGNDTIAQLQESYIFWRIVKGGPGLPKEASPATSAMPAWEDMLTEEEVWKTVLFLYDYTGNNPRSWGK